MATVRLAPVLRSSVGGSKHVNAQGSSLGEVLVDLYKRYPALKEHIQPEGSLSRFINVYLNDQDVRYLQGLRSLEDGFVPPVLVSGRDAIRHTRQLKDQEGIFAGPSCGAALHGALRVAASVGRGKIVVILADGGWKYLSEVLWTRELDQLEDDLEAKLLW